MSPCPSGKVGHPSRASARRSATAVGNKRTHARPRTYQCPHCHQWHLTSGRRVRAGKTGRREPTPPQTATPAELDAWFAKHSKTDQRKETDDADASGA